MKQILNQVAWFFWGHRWHLLVAIPAVVGFTVFHELAHSVAVWVQGGAVTAFVWLPAGSEWGHMCYSFPPDADYSEVAVSLSPYAFWVCFCLLAGVLSLRRTPWRFRYASTIFVWLFIVPLADIANAAIPYLFWNADNDLREAFGPVLSSTVIMAAVFGIIAVMGGFLINRRLYRERSLGFPAYGVLVVLAALLILVVN